MIDRLEKVLEFSNSRVSHKIIDPLAGLKTIYVLKCKPYCKVGYASNFKKRLGDYKVHNPFPVKVVMQIDTYYYEEFEKWIFANYAGNIKQGEWFIFSSEDLDYIKSQWFTETELYKGPAD